MQVDKASEKSVRITAMDTEDQGVKVFLISVRVTSELFHFQHSNLRYLIMWLRVLSLRVSPPQGSSKDIGQLAAALHHRILALKSRAEQESETPAAAIPEAEVPRSNEDDSDEEDNASASASASTPATSKIFFLLSICFRKLLLISFGY